MAPRPEQLATPGTIPTGLMPGTAPTVVIQPAYTDPSTGGLYVHRDLVLVRPDWVTETHRSPVKASEAFGDVESFAEYVTHHGNPATALLTWSERGLTATLDYHGTDPEVGGRCQWKALHPFVKSRQLLAWEHFAGGQARSQKEAIEQIEDLADDIVEPGAAALASLLRSLRANVNAKAETEIRSDGTQAVSWTRDQTVRTRPTNEEGVELPPHFEIGIPLLAGHLQGYRLKVRVRVSVDGNALLTLRFSLVNLEQSLEDAYAERVAAAKELLGDGFVLLRAA